MAVKGLDIFKLSPKKNCKECGSPTCMAFCMKVAQGAVPITKCPYMSEEAIALLSEATQPPMKTIEVGAHKLGGETVMMRHEKTLVNRNLFAATLATDMDDAAIDARIEGIKKVDYERIGEREMVECVFVHDAGDSAKFVELCKKAAALPDRTVIIDTKDVDTAKAAVEAIKDNKPILNGANKDNFAAMSEIAKAAGLVLGVSGKDLSELHDTVAELDVIADRDGLHGRRSGLGELCLGFFGEVRAFIQSDGALCDLHAEGHAGGAAAFLTVFLGRELKDIQAFQCHCMFLLPLRPALRSSR